MFLNVLFYLYFPVIYCSLSLPWWCPCICCCRRRSITIFFIFYIELLSLHIMRNYPLASYPPPPLTPRIKRENNRFFVHPPPFPPPLIVQISACKLYLHRSRCAAAIPPLLLAICKGWKIGRGGNKYCGEGGGGEIDDNFKPLTLFVSTV